MTKFIYRGNPYKSAAEIARSIGKKPLKVANLLIGHEGDVTEIVNAMIVRENEMERKLKMLNDCMGTDITSVGKAESELKKRYGVTISNLMRKLSYDDAIRLCNIAIRNKQLPVLNAYSEPFSYDKVNHDNFRKFCTYYNVSIDEFRVMYLKYDGDIEKSLANCTEVDNRKTYNFIINGVPYDSVASVAEKFKVPNTSLLKKLNEGMDVVDAINYLKENSNGPKIELPTITVNGREYSTQESLRIGLNISGLTAVKLYEESSSVLDYQNKIIEHWERKQETHIPDKIIDIRGFDEKIVDFLDEFSIRKDFLNAHKKSKMDMKEFTSLFINYMKPRYVTYGGEKHYSHYKLNTLYGNGFLSGVFRYIDFDKMDRKTIDEESSTIFNRMEEVQRVYENLGGKGQGNLSKLGEIVNLHVSDLATRLLVNADIQKVLEWTKKGVGFKYNPKLEKHLFLDGVLFNTLQPDLLKSGIPNESIIRIKGIYKNSLLGKSLIPYLEKTLNEYGIPFNKLEVVSTPEDSFTKILGGNFIKEFQSNNQLNDEKKIKELKDLVVIGDDLTTYNKFFNTNYKQITLLQEWANKTLDINLVKLRFTLGDTFKVIKLITLLYPTKLKPLLSTKKEDIHFGETYLPDKKDLYFRLELNIIALYHGLIDSHGDLLKACVFSYTYLYELFENNYIHYEGKKYYSVLDMCKSEGVSEKSFNVAYLKCRSISEAMVSLKENRVNEDAEILDIEFDNNLFENLYELKEYTNISTSTLKKLYDMYYKSNYATFENKLRAMVDNNLIHDRLNNMKTINSNPLL